MCVFAIWHVGGPEAHADVEQVLFMFAGMYFFRIRKGMGWPKRVGIKGAFARTE